MFYNSKSISTTSRRATAGNTAAGVLALALFRGFALAVALTVVCVFGSTAYADDHGNDCATATTVSCDRPITGELEEDLDCDCFKMEVVHVGNIHFEGTGGNIRYFLKPDCSVLYAGSGTGGGSWSFDYTVPDPGTYYFKICGDESLYGGGSLGPYTVDVWGYQGLECVGDGADDHGNDSGSATSVTCNSAISGDIQEAGDVDFFALDLTGEAEARWVSMSSTGDTNTYGFLYDSTGKEIASDDDSGDGENFRIAQSLDPGVYYIEVRHHYPDQTGTYTLHVGCEIDDHGDDCDNATLVECGSQTDGNIDTAGDQDYFKILFWGTGQVALYTTGGTDTYGYLLDSNCNPIASDDNSGQGNNFRITTMVSPGEYYIAVEHQDPDKTGRYTLNVDCEYTPVITASAEYGGTISPSGAVGVPYGSDQTFTITPTGENTIRNVWVDGEWVGAESSHTFYDVTRDHTIVAIFNADFENCVDISDVPLNARLRGAPANIMFVLDDSGSMDWEFMTQEDSGLFSGYSYVFDNPGDNLYSGILPRGTKRMMWKSQWSGYNRLYYDPSVVYEPWPGRDNADLDEPRSHPMHASPAFDLNETYQSYAPGDPGAIIVDDEDTAPNFVKTPEQASITINDRDTNCVKSTSGGGVWGSSTTSSQSYNSDHYYTSKTWCYYTATWTPDIPAPGQYEVYARWDDTVPNSSTSVPYTINHAGGSNTVSKDQNSNGGQWVLLGTYQFNAGTGGNVTILNYRPTSTWRMACVDAVKFVATGTGWDWATDSEAYNSHYLWTSADADYTATWTPDIPAFGQYEVYARWHADPSRSTAVPYTINHAGGPDTVTVNQQDHGGQWVLLGAYTFNEGTGGNVTITYTRSGENDTVCADAVSFVRSDIPDVIDIKRAHYYVWSDSQSKPYLVVLDGDIDYYVVDDKDGDGVIEEGEMLPTGSPPSDVQPSRTYAEERQNFANWYSFYRRRELTATASISRVIDSVQGVQVGFYSINGNLVQPVLRVKAGGADQSALLLGGLYNLSIRVQGTPLRRGLEEVGKYYYNSSKMIGKSPYAPADNGGECQQAFAIVMTDGFWNGWNPSVGNADGDNNTDFDGFPPYADTYSNTLADVAMKYYENDLCPDLDNLVPTNLADSAAHQHMVTYGISFGVTGTLNPDDYDEDLKHKTTGAPIEWPNPNGDQQKIDDLWHAAVNGRGEFLSASNPTQLIDSLLSIMRNIESRIASASSVSVNGDQFYEKLGADTRMFQATYCCDGWLGDVKAYEVDQATGEVSAIPLWSAAEELENLDWNSRIMATYNGTQGIPFRYNDSLTDDQKTHLGSDLVPGSPADQKAERILNYIRGDATNEKENGGDFRNRFTRLGDIVDSSPVYGNGILYTGGNDGMLHAFDAQTGTELFTYVPNLVFENLKDLVDPDYPHTFFVDLTPTVKNVTISGVTTLLVGGLGKGGKGYYALDISDPSSITDEPALAGKVLWEFTDSTDLGYTYSRPAIVNSRAGWIVIFGNGYNSPSGKAVLFILNASDGSVIKRIQATDTGFCNGLSSPSPVDIDFDNKVDYVYAGDLMGNLWKFDLTNESQGEWDVAFRDGATPKPLFQAKGPADSTQPITTKPDVMVHCEKHGYMVIFGTGTYLGEGDFSDTRLQSIYGVWDYGDDDDDSEYLGTFNRGATPELSNQPDEVTLLQQTQTAWTTAYGKALRTLSNNTPSWGTEDDEDSGQHPNPGSEPPETVHAGWYFDLPIEGERVVSDILIRDGKAIVISFIPEQTPCGSGGDSVFHEMDACTGGRLDEAQFDINGDGVIDENDLINIGVDGAPLWVAPTGIQFEGRLQPPTILRTGAEEILYLSSSSGDIERVKTKSTKLGITYWREF